MTDQQAGDRTPTEDLPPIEGAGAVSSHFESVTQSASPSSSVSLQPPSQNGIDIREALSILAARARGGSERDELRGGEEKVSEVKRSMGQTIDLLGNGGCDRSHPPTDEDSADEAKTASTTVELEEKRRALNETRKKRESEVRTKLEGMSIKSLLSAVLEAQRERTLTYREYDKGLETVLHTGNVTAYPKICAKATASFSVLSDLINSIKLVLRQKHNRLDLVRLLTELQKDEGEKLNLTAALHLERLRESNELGNYDGDNDDGGDERVERRLFREGVAALQRKVVKLAEKINDALEELRYAEAEEEE